jgi:hypothetical protein
VRRTNKYSGTSSVNAPEGIQESGFSRLEYEMYLPPLSGGAVDDGLSRG